MTFFVDVDPETIQRVIVRRLGANRFRVKTSLCLDRGLEVKVADAEIEGTPALRRALAQAGVARDAIEATFGVEPRWHWPAWFLPAASFAGSAILGGAVMMIF
ncbi:hypothetical protein [Rhizobium terrae]|uniref:hypothetical protein n=1 Tax=Rhizobium terrae TaxID=2171756 RepID=UPI000E3C32FF|nr:hypothetical protein [Rhizobium terrae]